METQAKSKILVVYYSRSGHTQKVAEELASKLNAAVERLQDQKSRKGILGWIGGGRDAVRQRETTIAEPQRDPAEYNLVVIGTPIWASRMTPAVRTYLSRYKDKFQQIACFTVAGGSGPEATVHAIETLVGKSAVGSAGFVNADFKKPAAYQQKMQEFVNVLQPASE